MTEEEWLKATDPTPMVEFLGGEASDRKLRLFAVACCRRIWNLLTDEQSRKAVDVAERLADGTVTSTERRAAALSVTQLQNIDGHGLWVARGAASCAVGVPARHAAEHASDNAAHGFSWSVTPRTPGRGQAHDEAQRNARLKAHGQERAAQVPLVRDIFGNPFQPVTVDPAWLTSNVVALAEGIYQDRAFDRMPILADALQDAGCNNQDVLDHCRSEGPHVRGCWLVDLLTGRK